MSILWIQWGVGCTIVFSHCYFLYTLLSPNSYGNHSALPLRQAFWAGNAYYVPIHILVEHIKCLRRVHFCFWLKYVAYVRAIFAEPFAMCIQHTIISNCVRHLTCLLKQKLRFAFCILVQRVFLFYFDFDSFRNCQTKMNCFIRYDWYSSLIYCMNLTVLPDQHSIYAMVTIATS